MKVIVVDQSEAYLHIVLDPRFPKYFEIYLHPSPVFPSGFIGWFTRVPFGFGPAAYMLNEVNSRILNRTLRLLVLVTLPLMFMLMISILRFVMSRGVILELI